MSHLRFGKSPIRSTYLVQDADFVAVHHFKFLAQMKVLDIAKPGATFLLNAPYDAAQVWENLPVEVQQQIIDKQLKVYVIDGSKVARAAGLGNRINTVMQPVLLRPLRRRPADEAIPIKRSIEYAYGKRGRTVVERNFRAVDAAVAAMTRLEIPEHASARCTGCRRCPTPPRLRQAVTAVMLRGEGDLPGQRHAGRRHLAHRHRKVGEALDRRRDPGVGPLDLHRLRQVRDHLPALGDPDQDLPRERARDAPESFQSKKYNDHNLKDHKLTVQVAPDDCTGCGICVDVCPAKQDRGQAQVDQHGPAPEHQPRERVNFDFFLGIPEVARDAVRHDQVKGARSSSRSSSSRWPAPGAARRHT